MQTAASYRFVTEGHLLHKWVRALRIVWKLFTFRFRTRDTVTPCALAIDSARGTYSAISLSVGTGARTQTLLTYLGDGETTRTRPKKGSLNYHMHCFILYGQCFTLFLERRVLLIISFPGQPYVYVNIILI